ncbi:hypothetical protein NA56DRAFT_704943 [Hyaloscypha hepaticicola]|uniref:Uncharacterized protein n=1 Tax=Hyaloscypha hepaticicola TaxID=2082293 RepID=A0A2J6Q1I3_9HELO|nr:hypothetical protein NA56DRAFT_704943 [Hyaloscypha hepaticicola]
MALAKPCYQSIPASPVPVALKLCGLCTLATNEGRNKFLSVKSSFAKILLLNDYQSYDQYACLYGQSKSRIANNSPTCTEQRAKVGKMTRSIAQASQTDGEILTASLSEEQTVASDRQTACRLGGVADPNPTEEMDEELLAKLSAFYIQVPAEEGDFEYATIEAVSESEPESSSWAATRPTARSIYRRYIAYPRAHSIL